MTAVEKVLDVERQVRAMLSGEQEAKFTCPFCTMTSDIGQFLCCGPAGEVINAVLDHIEHLERCDTVEHAMERMEAMRAKALLN